MKRNIVLLALLLAIPNLKAQEKEIRKAEKAVKAGNLTSAASYLSQAKRIFAAADDKTRSEYYVVEAEMRLAQKVLDVKQVELISQSLKLANRYEVTPTLQVRISQITLKIKEYSATIAETELANKNYSSAASLFNTAYQSSDNTLHLLKSARCYLLAEEYNDAYKAYNKLLEMGYGTTRTQFVATNVRSNKKEAFTSKEVRDIAISEGQYKKPETITTNNKLPELLRGITMAAIPINKQQQAMTVIDKALAEMPKDKMLLSQAAHLYKQLGAYDKYYAVVDQLIKESPKDPSLYYNVALTSSQNNDFDRAKRYYREALEADPNYTNAKVGLSMLLLEQDKVITDEMNELGLSETESERYEKLKQKRINLYYQVLPYLKSIVASQPENKDAAEKLKNIYSFIGKGTTVAILEEESDD